MGEDFSPKQLPETGKESAISWRALPDLEMQLKSEQTHYDAHNRNKSQRIENEGMTEMKILRRISGKAG